MRSDRLAEKNQTGGGIQDRLQLVLQLARNNCSENRVAVVHLADNHLGYKSTQNVESIRNLQWQLHFTRMLLI